MPATLPIPQLKPANFLVTLNNRLCLADFGTAEPKNATALSYMLTPSYAAPEQLTVVLPYLKQCLGVCLTDTRRIDVWQLGMVFLELLLPGAIHDPDSYAAIHSGRWALPACVPHELSDMLVNSMLCRQLEDRATANMLCGHPFFAGTDWSGILACRASISIDFAGLFCEA